MNKIGVDTVNKDYFYYKNPFDILVGDGKVFKESKNGGLVLNNCSCKLSEQQNKIIGAVSDFYKCLHEKYEIVNQDNLCYINKDLFEKFKPLQSFIFREHATKINLVDSKNNDLAFVVNLDSILDSFFRELRLLRCFYSTMDMLAPKNFEEKNISVNELLLKHNDIFKFKIITPQKNGIEASGNVSSVSKTNFNGQNYFYKKLSVCEKVPRISTNSKENDKNLNDQEKQNLSMGNYVEAKEGDLVIIDPVFRQLGQSVIAEHFGFDNIIPTEIGFLFLKEENDFEPVCLMEEAKGKIGYQILIYLDEDEKNEALSDIKHNNLDAEIVNANNPDLQIKSLELGIIDFIGLNPDRHAGNIFLYKTKDGNFKLTGIDNDWCFLIDPPGRFNLDNFFESKLPFITSNLKKKVLSGLSDDNIKKLLAKLEGKINRAPGGKAVIKAIKDRLCRLAGYIKKCEVIDKLNDKTAQSFMKEFDATKDNPISAMRYRIQSFCHPDKFVKLEKISNQFVTNDFIKIEEGNQSELINDENQSAKYNTNPDEQNMVHNKDDNSENNQENEDIKKMNNLNTTGNNNIQNNGFIRENTSNKNKNKINESDIKVDNESVDKNVKLEKTSKQFITNDLIKIEEVNQSELINDENQSTKYNTNPDEQNVVHNKDVSMLNNNLENETHADKLKRLGDQTLGAEFELSFGEQGNVVVRTNNVRDFINLICRPGNMDELRQNSQYFYKVRFWSQSDEIISKFIDYIECLETADIADMQYYNPGDPYGLRENNRQQMDGQMLLPKLNHNFETESEPDAESKLLIKKAYMILSLIKFGFCPFQIMNCLKSKTNNQNFNWGKIVDVIIHFERSQTKSEKKFFSSSYYPDRNHKAVHLIKFMSLVSPLLDNNANLEQQYFSEVDVADVFNFEFSVYDFLFFALSYARYKENKPEEEFLSNYATENWMSKYAADEDRNNLVGNYNNDVLFFLQDEHRFSGSLWEDKKSEEDFYTLAQNMDSVVFSVFVAMMMQHISFTKKQMEFIKNKVNNDAMFALLKRLNTNLNYKTIYNRYESLFDDRCERYVKFSAGSSCLDRVLRKIFKGIGYILFGLLAFTIVILPPLVIGTILAFGISMITTSWIAINIIPGGLLFGGLVIALHSCEKVKEFFFSLVLRLKSWYRGIPEAVTKFYDDKIGYLFNLYNLHFPTNNIGNPPAIQNISDPVVSVNSETGGVTDSISKKLKQPAEQPNINEAQIENRDGII